MKTLTLTQASVSEKTAPDQYFARMYRIISPLTIKVQPLCVATAKLRTNSGLWTSEIPRGK